MTAAKAAEEVTEATVQRINTASEAAGLTVAGASFSIGRQDLSAIISNWQSAGGEDQMLGGTSTSHVRLAAEARGDGRLPTVP